MKPVNNFSITKNSQCNIPADHLFRHYLLLKIVTYFFQFGCHTIDKYVVDLILNLKLNKQNISGFNVTEIEKGFFLL